MGETLTDCAASFVETVRLRMKMSEKDGNLLYISAWPVSSITAITTAFPISRYFRVSLVKTSTSPVPNISALENMLQIMLYARSSR